jgi:voltage-gated potassium channel
MRFRNKLYIVLVLTFLLLGIGTLGYTFIAGYSFVNALYMTVITISTVGFGEVAPLNENGKLFTIFLIFTSIGIYGYIVTVITEFIANGKLIREFKTKKMQKKIQKLSGHTIICGYGRNGRQAVAKLISHGQQCVIIENDKELVHEIEEQGFLTVKGNATDDIVLEKAGIKNASNLITTLPSDADNLFVVLSARQYNKNATLISRASYDSSERKLHIAGANNIIMPDKLGGDHMASLVVSPDIIEFVDKLTLDGNCKTNLEEIDVNQLPEMFINKSIRDLDLRRKTGCSIIGYKTTNNEYIINPEADMALLPNTKLIVLGRPEQIAKLEELYR